MPRILIVDDDDLFRNMLRITLIKMGHEVFTASNGEVALRLFGQLPLDILLTDLVMPEVEGLDLIFEFRSRQPGVRILAMSGAAKIIATNYTIMAKARGADAVLSKPFSNLELVKMMELPTSSID